MGVKRFTDLWKWPYFPIFAKYAGKKFLFSYSKEAIAIALLFIMCDGSWTNNLLVEILFHNFIP